MHEYGIVRDLLGLVDRNVRRYAGRRAVRVVVAVDGMTGAEERFMRDAFDTLKSETTAHDAVLVVEQAPVEVWCLECDARWKSSTGPDSCPNCGSGNTRSLRRQEIYLKSVEMEV